MAKLKVMHLAKYGSIFSYKRLRPIHYVAPVVADASRLAKWTSLQETFNLSFASGLTVICL